MPVVPQKTYFGNIFWLYVSGCKSDTQLIDSIRFIVLNICLRPTYVQSYLSVVAVGGWHA